MAKQLPLTTLPITDWQQAAQEPAATPTGLNPNIQQERPTSTAKEPRTKANTIKASIIKEILFYHLYIKFKV